MKKAESEVAIGYQAKDSKHILYIENAFFPFNMENQQYKFYFKDQDSKDNYRNSKYRFRVDFEVQVPKDMMTEASTINDGFVKITNMSGMVQANNINGDISVSTNRIKSVKSVNGKASTNGSPLLGTKLPSVSSGMADLTCV